MKKTYLILLIFFIFAVNIFAQSKSISEKLHGISLGGGALIGDGTTGGFIDIGFNIFKVNENTFSIRNHIQVGGAAIGSKGGEFTLRERLQFGYLSKISDELAIRGYGAVDFGFIFFAGEFKRKFFTEPYLMEVRGSGGIEIGLKSGCVFFVEAGGGGRFITKGKLQENSLNMPIGFGFISLGGRYYF